MKIALKNLPSNNVHCPTTTNILRDLNASFAFFLDSFEHLKQFQRLKKYEMITIHEEISLNCNFKSRSENACARRKEQNSKYLPKTG